MSAPAWSRLNSSTVGLHYTIESALGISGPGQPCPDHVIARPHVPLALLGNMLLDSWSDYSGPEPKRTARFGAAGPWRSPPSRCHHERSEATYSWLEMPTGL